MNIRPRQLPKVRDQLLRHLDDPGSGIRTVAGDLQTGLDALASHLRTGGLYWAAPDMTALAMSSGQQLAAARWATADRPTACGLIWFDGGIGMSEAHGITLPIEGCTWGPYRGACMLWMLMSRRRLVAEMKQIGSPYRLVEEETPPLIPVYGFTIPVTDEPLPMAEVDPEAPHPIVAAVAASWLLMQQPQLVDRTVERPDKAARRAYARAGREDPHVTVVDLRRQYVPQDQDPGEGEASRRYRHRWVVSGHWRDQPYGPDRSLRRKTWIPAHIKGPEGAPMLQTERVNVWRR